MLIFKDNHDYDRFIRLLFLCNTRKNVVVREIPIGLTYVFERGETIVDIGAYCLMPNHFHLLLREKIENGISLFMQKLTTSYSMYFNKKHKRTGGLFEGTFKATHADDDTYLKYLFSYIHLNPVKIIDPLWKENGIADRKKAKNFLDSYIYSSYRDYLGIDRKEKSILHIENFPKYFDGIAEFQLCVDELISYRDVT
ncbi:MAG: transposase [Patescibacteria group bacterium]